ncbi:LysR family transcriptional regulator [bacterium]|nr:MAG: LysR family transcriptional regulator [bacterium]
MAIDLQQVRCFNAVYESGSFTAAAEALGITQPAVSHHIRRLELQIGVPVFERTGKRVLLTPVGRRILEDIRQIISGLQRLELRAAGGRELMEARVACGVFPSLRNELLTGVLRAFQHEYGEAELVLDEQGEPEIAQGVRLGRLDIGVFPAAGAAASLHLARLYDEELCLLVADHHVLAGRGEVDLAELEGLDVVLPARRYALRQVVDSTFRAAGIELGTIIEGGGGDAGRARLVPVLGATLVGASSCEQIPGGTAMVRLAGAPLMRSVHVGWREDRIPSPAAGALLEIFQREAERLAA